MIECSYKFMTKFNLKNLENKKIAALGLGVENLVLIKFLLKNKVKCNIVVCDPKSAAELGDRFLDIKLLARKNKLPEIILMTGKNYDAHLTDFDIVSRSPGYPLFNSNITKAKKAGVEISSAMEMFFALCPTKNIIGVTGSKGKGTVSSLIYEVIKTDKRKVWLGGNIGTAPFEFIDKIKATDFVVLELSSFQLEDLQVSPHIAVITNLFKEHLAPADPNNPNYHKSMKDYWTAKANIFTHQSVKDFLVVNEDIQLADYGFRTKGRIFIYSQAELANNLIGEHNKQNIAAAIAVASILKIKPEVIIKAIKKFKGLPHRLEFVAEEGGVKYFDDSFATVPDVSVIALKSFPGKKNIILLAGGADKGSNFKKFASEIKKRVKLLILFKGKGSERLKKELRAVRYELCVEVDNMKDAVKIAKQESEAGDIVLLSTGCASFGCFKNYKERGNLFKAEIKN
jgi:UDP-N-acetylmuramoylalanine--D-glutamate ligase